jgi:glycyl-tRNA synthetase beta chain/uncharacterized protein
VLVVADKIASLTDMTSFVGGLISGRSLRVRRSLCQTDPFYTPRRRRRRIGRLWRSIGRRGLSGKS